METEQKSLLLLALKMMEREYSDLESLLYFFNSDYKKLLEFITIFGGKTLRIPKLTNFRNSLVATIYLHCVLTNKNIKEYMSKYGVVGAESLKTTEKLAMKLKNKISYEDLMVIKDIAMLQGDKNARR